MVNHPNRSTLSVILASCEANRIEAGLCRDGTGVARITPVLNVLRCAREDLPRYGRRSRSTKRPSPL